MANKRIITADSTNLRRNNGKFLTKPIAVSENHRQNNPRHERTPHKAQPRKGYAHDHHDNVFKTKSHNVYTPKTLKNGPN